MITQISASAGSGKTYSLTQLFLELLEGADALPQASGCALHGRNHGYSLAEILAATFTNKAATEMKSRVISSLKEKALAERGDLNEKAPGRAGIWVERILRHYGALNIRTIDSLLAALVRLSALDLELPPDFEPSFEPGEFFTPVYDGLMEDLAANGRLMEAVTGRDGPESACQSEAREEFEDEEWRESRFEDRNGAGGGLRTESTVFYTADPAALRADLIRACQSLLFLGDCKGFTPKKRLHDQVFELVRRLLTGRVVPRMDADAILARLSARRENLIAAAGELHRLLMAEQLKVHNTFATVLTTCAGLSGHAAPPKGSFARKQSLDECLNAPSRGKASEASLAAFANFRTALDGYSASLPLFRQAAQLAPLTGLALEIHSRMRANRFTDSLLPAISIPFLAGQALSGEYGVSDALCRLGTRLSRLLLDEFQDTSREQWAAILPLVEESLSTGGALTYVGDVKQAIYGWRGGDARLFDQVMDDPLLRKMKPRKETRNLPFNWRSHPAIVAHNNAFFSLLRDPDVSGRTLAAMLPDDTPEHYRAKAADEVRRIFDRVEQTIPPEKDWDSDPGGRHAGVRHYIVEGNKVDEVRELVRGRMRALFLEELLPVWRCGDIAILTRSGDEGSLAAEWLTSWGLPVVTENSFLLAAHPLVSKLVSFLAFLDYPPDDLAFWEVAGDPESFWPESGLCSADLMDWLARSSLEQGKSRPPLYRLFRDAFPGVWNSRIAPFHSGAGLMSAYDTLREAIRRFSLFERMPEHTPFLLRLLEIAHLAEARGHSSLAAFLVFWRGCRDDEQLPLPEGMNAVRIMTVHKAKGLEFPVVVLPFQHQGRRRDPELVRLRRDGLEILARAGGELPDIHYPARITDELERLNLLYVAWTRPVYALHSFITRPRSASSPLQRGLNILLTAHAGRAGQDLCQWEWLGEQGEGEKDGEKKTGDGDAPLFPGALLTQAPDEQNGAGNVPESRVLSTPRPPASLPSSSADWRPMDWLPRLKIYRSTLEGARFTPARRGMLAHLCLEHLMLSDPHDSERLTADVRRAVRQGMRLFPLPVEDPEAVARGMEDCLLWFASLPAAPLWLAHGLREQGVIDARGNMHRVDLLVDEALTSPHPTPFLHALDYKTGRWPTEGIREEHQRQARRYMRLISEARGRPARGTLVYLDERRLEEVSL